MLRIVGQWENFVGYYDLWYNKGLHKAGEILIEQGLCNKRVKIYVGCARLEEEPIISRQKRARWEFLCSIFILTHHFAVASLMSVSLN